MRDVQHSLQHRMNAIGAALGPVFLLILSGALLRRLDLPGEHFWPNAERLTYYLLFPALLVYKLATAAMGEIALGNIFGNIVSMLPAGTLLLYLLRGRVAADIPAFTSVYQRSIRFNTYIGLACVDALYGDPGVVAAAIAMLIPLINLLCVSAFHLGLHRGSLGTLAGSLLRNPLILACGIGIVLNRSGIGLPGWTADTLALLGSAALPHFAARRSQSHLMRWLSWLNRPDPGPVTLSNQTVSRAPPLPGVAGNVLVLPERIFLT